MTLLGFALASSVHAARLCGDATNDGRVSISDAVLALQVAAGVLPNGCSRSVCDLDLNGKVSVTDGVRMLRLAAGLDLNEATCAATEAGNASNRAVGTLGDFTKYNLGASIASTVEPCPDGGTVTRSDDGFVDDQCRNGDIVTTGAVSIVLDGGAARYRVALAGYSATRLSTHETLISSGTITIADQPASYVLNGTLHRSSNLLGTFDDAFEDVVADKSVRLLSGAVTTTVTDGMGRYLGLKALRLQLFPSLTTIVTVDYAAADSDQFVTAQNGGLCDACSSSSSCPDRLECVVCGADCTNGTRKRCAPPEIPIVCDDGQY